MDLLTSTRLRARHGFPTRLGGVSQGAFASLNASLTVGDAPDAVAHNLVLLARAAGVSPERLVTARQVHGVNVVRAEPGSPAEADALWTSEPGVAVGVRTADCLPVLFEDADRGLVAAAHAGWRGLLGGVLTGTVLALEAAGARRAQLAAAVGPCIRACCFEVDGDLPQRFAQAFGPEVVVAGARPGRVHLDLQAAARLELERAGVPARAIEVLAACTCCEPRFFSHRRDRGLTGRHLSFITCPQSPGSVVL